MERRYKLGDNQFARIATPLRQDGDALPPRISFEEIRGERPTCYVTYEAKATSS